MNHPLEHRYTVPQLLLLADIQKDILSTDLHPTLNALSEELFNIVEDHQSRRNEQGHPVYRMVKGTMVRDAIDAVNDLLVQDLTAAKPNTEQLERLKDNLLKLNSDKNLMATLGQEAFLESVNDGRHNSGNADAMPGTLLLYTAQTNGTVKLLLEDRRYIETARDNLLLVNQGGHYNEIFTSLENLLENGTPLPRKHLQQALNHLNASISQEMLGDHLPYDLIVTRNSLLELTGRDRLGIFEKQKGEGGLSMNN